jgi:hypothetical protein
VCIKHSDCWQLMGQNEASLQAISNSLITTGYKRLYSSHCTWVKSPPQHRQDFSVPAGPATLYFLRTIQEHLRSKHYQQSCNRPSHTRSRNCARFSKLSQPYKTSSVAPSVCPVHQARIWPETPKVGECACVDHRFSCPSANASCSVFYNDARAQCRLVPSVKHVS